MNKLRRSNKGFADLRFESSGGAEAEFQAAAVNGDLRSHAVDSGFGGSDDDDGPTGSSMLGAVSEAATYLSVPGVHYRSGNGGKSAAVQFNPDPMHQFLSRG